NNTYLGGRVLQWTGSSFADYGFAASGGMYLNRIWSVTPSDVWAVGNGSPYHFTGSSFAAVGTGGMREGIWAASASAVWSAGSNGRIEIWNGTAWQASPNPYSGTTTEFVDLWGISANDIWATSTSGALRWNGAAWSAMPGVPGTLRSVWGTSAA